VWVVTWMTREGFIYIILLLMYLCWVKVIRVQIFSLEEEKIHYVNIQSFPQGLQNSWAICGDDLPHDYGWPPAVCVNLSCFCHGIFSGYVHAGDNDNALACNKTLIQMSHIKTLKITPTYFDHQMIIVRELFDPG
jgi:hypothetical protein